jgi:hypothetical protein
MLEEKIKRETENTFASGNLGLAAVPLGAGEDLPRCHVEGVSGLAALPRGGGWWPRCVAMWGAREPRRRGGDDVEDGGASGDEDEASRSKTGASARPAEPRKRLAATGAEGRGRRHRLMRRGERTRARPAGWR